MSNTQYTFMLRRLATILAVTTLTLSLVAAVTGVLLAFYYGANAGGANEEIKYIVDEVPNGWLIYSLHNTAGNGLIAVCLDHALPGIPFVVSFEPDVWGYGETAPLAICQAALYRFKRVQVKVLSSE